MYQSKVNSTDSQRMNNFLENSQIPKLDEAAAEVMDAAISLEEIQMLPLNSLTIKPTALMGSPLNFLKKYLQNYHPHCTVLTLLLSLKKTRILWKCHHIVQYPSSRWKQKY